MASETDNEEVPADLDWAYLTSSVDSREMQERYGLILRGLGERGGLLGVIFGNARNKVSDPAKLRLLVEQCIGSIDWSSVSFDVKGEAYEGLLEKNARDTKSGAGQYFTPRPVVDAMVSCIDPNFDETINDPACGTGGFLLSAHEYMRTKDPTRAIPANALHGTELVEEVARLAAMNLYLHGVGEVEGGILPISRGDSLERPSSKNFDVVLTNPPFGVKGSVTYVGTDGRIAKSADDLTVLRPDFTVRTSNKQLNFLQHIVSSLKPGGRAAVVVPDNVFYESGAALAIRRRLFRDNSVRAILALPTGLFYAQSVKASVLFFSKGRDLAGSSPRGIWTYDLRTNGRYSLKSKPLRHTDLVDFIDAFRNTPDGSTDLALETQVWKMHEERSLIEDSEAFYGLWRAPKVDHGTSVNRLNELSAQVISDLEGAVRLVRSATAQSQTRSHEDT